MSDRKRRVPKLQLHKASGQARVRIDGRDYYCGPWGSDAAEEEYRRLIGQWLLTGAPKRPEAAAAVSVNELCLAFLRHAEQHYRKAGRVTAEYECFKSAIRPLKALYGSVAVTEFGPLALQTVREAMVGNGWTRYYVNKSVSRLRRVFRWGVSKEIVPAAVVASLETVEPLRSGRTSAPDRPKRKALTQERINRIREEVPQRTRDLMDLQLLTAARPGELLMLTSAMIDRGGSVWVATIAGHKTEHEGKERLLFLGPKAQLILRRYLNDAEPGRLLFDGYERQSYGKVVREACDRLQVPRWSPLWLRHTALTRLRKEYGLDAAQKLGGHTRTATTEGYAPPDLQAALDVAARVG